MEIRKDEGNRPFAERSGALTQPRSLTYYKWGLAAGWTVVIVVLLAINLTQERSQAIETARTQARSNYERDVVYRHWNAMYGAVYVPVSEKIQPNPYLADHPERDVTTDRGKKLTLINPSYEPAGSRYGVAVVRRQGTHHESAPLAAAKPPR